MPLNPFAFPHAYSHHEARDQAKSIRLLPCRESYSYPDGRNTDQEDTMNKLDSQAPMQDMVPEIAEQQLNLIRYKRALARRNFMKNIGLAGVGIAAGAMMEACSNNSTNAQTAAIPQTDVLNFALNLEYLEAEFYSVAVTGSHLSSSVTG